MFDIGWSEMLVIAIVMIVVVGPKDLPRMLRTFGKTTAKLRAMAGDFQKQFNDALKEADLEDLKKSVDELRGLNPASEIRKQMNPFEKAALDVRSGLDSAMKSQPSSTAVPAAAEARAAEPLKNGATEMPGVGGPTAMPSETPAFPPIAEPPMSLNAGADAAIAAAIPPTAKRTPRPKAATTGAPAKAAAKPKAAARTKTAASKTKTAGSAS